MDITFSIDLVRGEETCSGVLATKVIKLDFIPFIGMDIEHELIDGYLPVISVTARIGDDESFYVKLDKYSIREELFDKKVNQFKYDGWDVSGA